MRGCMLPFCSNRGSKPGKRYFRLTDGRRDVWLRALGRQITDVVSPGSSVCSDHFKTKDFVDVKGKMMLRPDAVPSVNLKPRRPQWIPQSRTQRIDSKPSFICIEGISDISSLFQIYNTQITSTSDISSATPSGSQHVPPQNFPGMFSSQKEVQLEDSFISNNISSSSLSSTSTDQSSPSSDSEGLRGSPKKQRKVIKLMHNYSASPRKLSAQVSELQQLNNKLKQDVKTQKARVGRLLQKVDMLKRKVVELRRVRHISGNTKQALKKAPPKGFSEVERMVEILQRGKISIVKLRYIEKRKD